MADDNWLGKRLKELDIPESMKVDLSDLLTGMFEILNNSVKTIELTYLKTIELSYQRIRDRTEGLESVLRQIINSLPSNKDWLDPDVEKEARKLLRNEKSV